MDSQEKKQFSEIDICDTLQSRITTAQAAQLQLADAAAASGLG